MRGLGGSFAGNRSQSSPSGDNYERREHGLKPLAVEYGCQHRDNDGE